MPSEPLNTNSPISDITPPFPGKNIPAAAYLDEKLNENIEILKRKTTKAKTAVKVSNGMMIFLGAMVTLTLGFDFGDKFVVFQHNVALVLSAFLTIITSWSAFFDYKKLWLRHKTTLLSLYQLKNELNYLTAKGHIDPQSLERLNNKYLSVWEQSGQSWVEINHNTTTNEENNSNN